VYKTVFRNLQNCSRFRSDTKRSDTLNSASFDLCLTEIVFST